MKLRFLCVLAALTVIARAQSAPERLNALLDAEWTHQMTEFPESATYTGFPGQNHRWADMSQAAIDRRNEHARALLPRIDAIDRDALAAPDRLNFDLFRREAAEAIEGQAFPEVYLPVNQLSGVQQDLAAMISRMPAADRADYDDILARLEAAPARIEQEINLMKRGLELGVTPPKVTLRDLPEQVRNQFDGEPERGPFFEPFTAMPGSIPEADRAAMAAAAKKAIAEGIVPAFERLHSFLVDTYIPNAVESIAAIDRPNGKAWYEYNARVRTTTNKTPREIHELGLSEVKRIRGEMDQVIESTGFKGDFAAFCEYLRTDPKFYFTSPGDLMMAYRDIAKRIDPELMKLFGKLPRTPYGVLPVPSYAEKSQTTAYYMSGSPEAGRPGYFYANLYNLDTRPKWEMEALTAHEAVPGHHLQISIAQELDGIPAFRRYGGPTAFVEGWGLYSESLGADIGLYKDPYSRFGQLTYEIWRAVRLVVDTGMHAFAWTRQQAIDFFAENSSKPLHDITVEIDRYIVWPGQALAYKIGELKFKELRERARVALGEDFDLRAFHDACLENGALPMDVLEERIDAWLARQAKAD